MDVPRTRPARGRRNALLVAAAVLALGGVTFGLSKLGTAAPSVKRSSLWLGTVKRGELVRDVRGTGTLQPEQIRFVSAAWAARVETIRVTAGTRVEADTVLLELSNPELELQALEAERLYASAQATLVELTTQGTSTQLQLDAALATLKFDLDEARRLAVANERLAEKGMISAQEKSRTTDKAVELERRYALEDGRRAVLKKGTESQQAAQREQLSRLKAVAEFRRRQVEGLKVRAGERGVVQELPLQPGQWVSAGTLLAKVAQPEKLKAEVRISEGQARDVTLGQRASIDTRQGVVTGHVTRIDPAVIAGAVKVDVAFDELLPKGARPDLSIEGTIELERLLGVLFVGRPAFAQGDAVVQLFKVEGSSATRVPVQLGKGSVTQVEVLKGLSEGDEVVLSDMTQHERNERLELQ